jgi:hypothetical protein
MGRLTTGLEPDVDRHLETARRAARRRTIVRRAGAGLAIAASIVVVVLAAPRVLDAIRSESIPASHGSVGPATIAGTYTVRVPPGSSVVDEQGLAGTWTFELTAEGSMLVTSPPSYTGAVEGASFDVEGSVFRTDAFINDLCNEAQGAGTPVGEYRWEQIGGNLVLEVRSDACPGRVAILEGILRAVG